LLFLSGSIVCWGMTGRFAASDDKPAASSSLSTHVLNTTSGKPVSGMAVLLQMHTRQGWEDLSRAETDRQGRVSDLPAPGKTLEAGTYRLVFETGKYFQSQRTTTFFPRVEIVFGIEKTDEHYHVPLLISPYGYSTYRGS
jgi:5-hydroxyisourate hydrolase